MSEAIECADVCYRIETARSYKHVVKNVPLLGFVVGAENYTCFSHANLGFKREKSL